MTSLHRDAVTERRGRGVADIVTLEQRVAVVLRHLLDQDDQEIAQALGCSSATVRSHLSQARAALRLSAHTLTERS
ncbi:sigma factor-like helix-turn-helix DNA-binding protein [Streptomyces sp. NPDC047079]|uniref:sigma factor-like helix-turn-helix DNA-binding protein n=1 Tax=Streptomyces sp. NPDC047079 TaxID=3154607 RepID=UPI0033CFA17C